MNNHKAYLSVLAAATLVVTSVLPASADTTPPATSAAKARTPANVVSPIKVQPTATPVARPPSVDQRLPVTPPTDPSTALQTPAGVVAPVKNSTDVLRTPAGAVDPLVNQGGVLRAPADMAAPKIVPFTWLTAAWEADRGQLDAFAVDHTGTLMDVSLPSTGPPDPQSYQFPNPSSPLSRPGLAPPGAPVTAVWQPVNNQMEVFVVNTSGAITNFSKRSPTRLVPSIWIPVGALTDTAFARPGAPIVAVWQPLNEQLEVFVVDDTGALKGVWREHNGAWKPPFNLTGPGFAPPGAPLAAVWEPASETLEVFAVDDAGALNHVWKRHNGAWASPSRITDLGIARPGTSLTAAYDPVADQVWVMVIDASGTIIGVEKDRVGVPVRVDRWHPPITVYPARGTLQPSAPLASAWDPQFKALEVRTMSTDGRIMRASYQHNRFGGSWHEYSDPLTPAGYARPGGPIAVVGPPDSGCYDPTGFAQVCGPGVLDRFGVTALTTDDHAAIKATWKGPGGLALTRTDLGPIYGAHAAWCMDTMRAWSGHSDGQLDDVHSCWKFMGIERHCGNQDAYVQDVDDGNNTHPRYVVCKPISHPADIVDQASAIAQGLLDALIAAAPFFGTGVESTACVTGVIFACATLAVDIAGRAGVLPPGVAKDAFDLASKASDCADGDIVACVQLGAKGAQHAGVDIPGDDLGEVAGEVQRCSDGSFEACLRLGEKAAGAAGVQYGGLSEAAKNAPACADGDFESCTALGQAAAQARVPVGDMSQGAYNLQQCNLGDILACNQLGQALASARR